MTKAREMLEIADAYEAGLQKMIACGYEEYGPEPQRKHRLIIEALRLAAQADAPAILPQRMPEQIIEACAKIAEPWAGFWPQDDATATDKAIIEVRTEIAKKIRALALSRSDDPPQETPLTDDLLRALKSIADFPVNNLQHQIAIEALRHALSFTRPECGDVT